MRGGGRAGLVELAEFCSAGSGQLAVATCGSELPFVVHRVFSLYGAAAGGARHGPAHRRCQQFLICPTGSARVSAEDAQGTTSFQLDHPAQGLYVPAMTWLSLVPLDGDTVVVVLASEAYDENDYIRDPAAFAAACRELGQ
jgi:hypothetical protein